MQQSRSKRAGFLLDQPATSRVAPVGRAQSSEAALENAALSLPKTDLVRGRKITWNFLRYLSRRGPLGAALQRGDEANAFLRRDVFPVVVPERGVKHATLAELNHHQH